MKNDSKSPLQKGEETYHNTLSKARPQPIKPHMVKGWNMKEREILVRILILIQLIL